ncbi:MAG: metallophosphoesterase [Synechococcaceae cyanobacterium]|nr:metallophosphoesterase [Synechococcaceae cyanobacterium]
MSRSATPLTTSGDGLSPQQPPSTLPRQRPGGRHGPGSRRPAASGPSENPAAQTAEPAVPAPQTAASKEAVPTHHRAGSAGGRRSGAARGPNPLTSIGTFPLVAIGSGAGESTGPGNGADPSPSLAEALGRSPAEPLATGPVGRSSPVVALGAGPVVAIGAGLVVANGTDPVVAIRTGPVVAIGAGPVVAIGDVHGSASLLRQELEKHEGSGAELILLGDLIDRAPEPDGDRQVLELVWRLQANPELWGLAGVTVLRGNHEQMALAAMQEARPGRATSLWRSNGGNLSLLPWLRQHRAWFEGLPHTAIRGRYLFVHAGVRPGVPLEQQKDDDLIWIRQPFLSRPHGLPYTVVHGHSITGDHRIDRRADRINLDTGAFYSGVLSSLRLDPAAPEPSEQLPQQRNGPEPAATARSSRRRRVA